jgi:SPOR domain
MKLLRLASALALAATVSGTSAGAYTLSQAAKPAEYPPASYRSDVYVDSRGCAYVRASIGTAVNWVPRLSRDRKTVICGLTPTAKVTAMATSRPPAPPVPPAPTALAAAAPQPGPTTARQATPAPTPTTTAVTRTMAVTCPADGVTARVRIGGDTVGIQCPPGQTTSKSYIVRHANGERTRVIAKPPVAPVPAAPVATANARRVGVGDLVAGGRVIIGRVPPGGPTNGFGNGYGVAAPTAGGGYTFGQGFGLTDYPGVMDPVPSPASAGSPLMAAPVGTIKPVIPEGYRPAWTDDRLNPNRGPRTLYGDQQMAATVTIDDVPMRTVDPAQARGLILQQPSGLLLSSKSPSAVAAAAARAPAPVATTASAAAPAKRYVQVGMFAVSANAQRAAAKLQSLGLPGRVAQTASGKTVVIAGPYGSVPAVNAALATARRGFPDAFLRN